MFDGLPIVLRWAVLAVIVVALAISLRSALSPRRKASPGLYAADRESDIGHVVMLAAMLAMGVAEPGLVPNALWRAVFAGAAIAYTALLVIRLASRGSRPDGDRAVSGVGSAVYHVVAALAMCYTTFKAGGTGGMAAHHAAPPWPALGWLLTTAFVLDAAVQSLVAVTLRAPGIVAGKLPSETRVAVFPHVVMDIAMAAMLVAALCPATSMGH